MIGLAYPPLSETARQRLDYFQSTPDGFKIAEADLILRGPGEIFGVRQSGLPQLRVVRISDDRDLIESARLLVERVFVERDKLDSQFHRLYTYLVEISGRRHAPPGGG